MYIRPTRTATVATELRTRIFLKEKVEKESASWTWTGAGSTAEGLTAEGSTHILLLQILRTTGKPAFWERPSGDLAGQRRILQTIPDLMGSGWREASRSHVISCQPSSELWMRHFVGAGGSSQNYMDILKIINSNSPAWR